MEEATSQLIIDSQPMGSTPADARLMDSHGPELLKVSSSPGADFSPFAVCLDFFSGPMDLLLHLVHQQEVPIESVRMSVVAEQYLEIVTRSAQRLDLEKASEYLVIAATLLAIKSRSVLPNATEEEPAGSEEEWIDHRFFEDLRARLRAYELTKSRAHALTQTPQLGVDTFSRLDRKALQPTPEMLAEPEDSYTLGLLFGKLLRRIGLSGMALRIALEPVSVVGFMMKIVDQLSSHVRVSAGKAGSFRTILRSIVPAEQLAAIGKGRRKAVHQVRGVVIGSFIAVLELAKRGVLSVSQDEAGGDLELSMRMQGTEMSADAVDLTSEFDLEPTPLEATGAAPGGELPGKVIQIADYRVLPHSTEAEKSDKLREGNVTAGEAQEIRILREAGNV